MNLCPDHLPNETFGEYRVRNNLPYVYEPYFPGGGSQVEWQVELQKQFPTVWLYPYDGLSVGGANKAVFVLFENESQITEMAREKIMYCCMDYGIEVAEKAVPPLESLKSMYETAKKQMG
jgi:hypothetical protein